MFIYFRQRTEKNDRKREIKQKAGYNQRTALLNCMPSPSDVKSIIFNVLWEMKKRGLAESTLSNTRKALMSLSKHSNLDDAEHVEGFIARLDRKNM